MESICRKGQPISLFGKMQITQPSVCHFCKCAPQECTSTMLLLCRNAVYEPAADRWGSASKLAAGQMASPRSAEDSGSEKGGHGGGGGGGRGLWVTQHKGVNHGSLRGRVTDWLTGVWIHRSLWKRLRSKATERRSACVYSTGVCADEPTHSSCQESRVHVRAVAPTHAHQKGLMSFLKWRSCAANEIFPIRGQSERWTHVAFGYGLFVMTAYYIFRDSG